MVAPSPMTISWIRSLNHRFWPALCGLLIASVVLLTGQAVVQSEFVPSLSGLILIAVGFLPEMIAVFSPVALLFASVATGRLWMERGDLLALGAAGRSTQRLIPACCLAGFVIAAGVGLCTHVLGPLGRGMVRSAITQAVDDLQLRPGQPVPVGDGVLRVAKEQDRTVSGVFYAVGDVVMWAPKGQLGSDGEVVLERGQAMKLDESWKMEFEQAHTNLSPNRAGIHNFERSSPSLLGLIERMESRGVDASKERLVLYKRTVLPLSVPVLALLGLPLGARFRRPAWLTVGVVLGLWAAQRVGDHVVKDVGPSGMALLPFVILGLVTLSVWTRWRLR
jgi:lipopolysaccharide export LptBFGC system permease protein LptF